MSGMIEVLIWTLGISFLIALIYRFLTNPDDLRRIRSNMKEVQGKVKKAQKAGNMEEMNALTSEMLKLSQQQFTKNMKPMIASAVIFFVFLGFIRVQYSNFKIATPFTIPVIGSDMGWFLWYIVITIPATLLFRKLLGAE